MGCQRLIYNAKVEEDRYFRTFSRKALALVDLQPPVDQQYAQFKSKELTPYLYEVPSQILRNGATRFMQAYRRYFKGLALRPAFKKKYGKQSVWLTGELFKFVATGKSRNRRNRRKGHCCCPGGGFAQPLRIYGHGIAYLYHPGE